MILDPKNIYEEYKKDVLNKRATIESLISFIENSDNEDLRIDALYIFEKISGKSKSEFQFLENLLLSDSNAKIRRLSAQIIKDNFLNDALTPMKWALQHESDYECLITIIKAISEIEINESKPILLNEIKKIKKRKYIDIVSNQYYNTKFRYSLKILFKQKRIQKYSCKELAEIIINFRTIENFIRNFYTVSFDLEDALVIKLDLSDLGWNVNIWRQPFANRIEKFSEITGLLNLKNLKHLDLSNNRISDVETLINLKYLVELKISNNRIEDGKNLEYFKKMSSLRYLDVRKNKIVDKIDLQEFNHELKIVFKNGLYFH